MSLLTIAGVRVRALRAGSLFGPEDSAYLPFAASAPDFGGCMSTIDVEVVGARAPRNDSPVLFRSGEAWSFQSEAGGYRVTYEATENGRPSIVARSDALTTRVRVYVEPEGLGSQVAPELLVRSLRYPLMQVAMMNHLATRGGVIVHAAAAVVGGQALVFAGVSGAGKSTISQLFAAADLGGSLLSDDRVILRANSVERGPVQEGPREVGLVGAFYEAWGTPWHGDAYVARNDHAPLGAMLFLVKADSDEMVPIDTSAAMRRLAPVVSCPWYDLERGNLVLETCGRIIESTPCYELRFRPGRDVVDLLTGRSWGA